MEMSEKESFVSRKAKNWHNEGKWLNRKERRQIFNKRRKENTNSKIK